MNIYKHASGVCVQDVHVYTVYSTEDPRLAPGLYSASGVCFIDWGRNTTLNETNK